MPGYIHGTPQEADYDLKEALAEKARRAVEAAGYAKGGPVMGDHKGGSCVNSGAYSKRSK